jgi:hypothetical protein
VADRWRVAEQAAGEIDEVVEVEDLDRLAHWGTIVLSAFCDGALMHPRCHQVTALLA